MGKGFRDFIMRGNVVDLAVGVVIGAAFGGVVSGFVKDLLTPLIGAMVRKPDSSERQSGHECRGLTTTRLWIQSQLP